MLTTAGEAVDTSTDFNSEVWGQNFYNSDFTDKSDLEDLDRVFSTATTQMVPTKAKVADSEPSMSKGTSKAYGRGIFPNLCTFSPPQCNTAALKVLLLVLLLTPLAWGSNLDKQIEEAGRSSKHAHIFVPHYKASTIGASVSTKAPANIFIRAYKSRTGLWDPVARQKSQINLNDNLNTFMPASQLYEFCIDVCVQHILVPPNTYNFRKGKRRPSRVQ